MRSFTLFSTLAVLASVVAADFSPAPIPKGANPVLPPTDVSLAKRDICILGICVGTSTSSSSAYQTDVNNCGSKGNKCTTNWLFGTGRQCVAGVCAPTSCNSLFDFNWLTGACQDVSSDTSNCGKCGQTCSTSTVSNSLSTKCVSGTCYAQSCATGYTLASGVCTKNIDTTSDTSNCGAVGTKCPTSYSNGSGSICSNSVCQPKSCSTGYAFDYSSKICRNILSDTSNCGSCGNVCQYAGGTGQCSNGVCSLKSCNSGYYNIGGTCTSLNLKTDAANCGTVGNDCNTKYANGVGSCSSGTCSLTGCQTGYELTTTYFLFWPTGSSCTAIDTTSDSDNCGAVGNSCPSSVANGGSASCKNSQCVASCNSGYTWDSTSLTCKNTATDCSNCGGVGKSCTVANGTPKCSSGVCSVDTCNTGYQLSNGACVAINTSTDTKNCGGLNIFCSSTYANGGVGICVLGKCITTCNVLYDWDSTLGFCRSVSSDVSNCGKCGSTCSTSTVTGSKSVACTSGKCLATVCNDGYTLSNGVCTAVDYSSDVNNCGGKNNACSFLPSGATGACIKSVCTLQTCPTSYVLKSGVCVKSTASQAARLAKKDKVIESRSLCPAKETACPIRGSTTYDAAVSHHFSTQDEFSGVMLGQGGYECLDVSSSLESCGGCASTGEGRDCSAIRGAAGVGCDAGVCRILSCQGGYKVSLDGSKCVRVKSHAHGRNSTSSSAAKRHLAARHGSHGSL